MNTRLVASFLIALSLLTNGMLLAVPRNSRSGSRPKSPVVTDKARTPERRGGNVARTPARRNQSATQASQTPATLPGQSATLLPDGRWLLVGGSKDAGVIDTAEIYDARSGARTALANKLQQGRSGHTATLLPDGRILIFGGKNPQGELVDTSEVFNMETQSFAVFAEMRLATRSNHTATVLPDGRVLFVGGKTKEEEATAKAELWNPRTGEVEAVRGQLQTARVGHTAELLPDGSVLIWGGAGAGGMEQIAGEMYNSDSQTFTWTAERRSDDLASPPILSKSAPQDGARGVTANTLIALSFSKRMRVESLSTATVKLRSQGGETAIKVMPVERGVLAFVTAQTPLQANTSYTLEIAGATDERGQSLPYTALTFTTAGGGDNGHHDGGGEHGEHGNGEVNNSGGHDDGSMHPTHDHMQMQDYAANRSGLPADSEEWIPTPETRAEWKSKRERFMNRLAPLKAADGVTALTGRVLTLEDEPLANVTLNVAGRSVRTDETGRFLLTEVKSGRQALVINGGTASTTNKPYGMFDVGVDVKAGQTNVLPYTIWIPVIDTRNVNELPERSASKIVARTSRIPGLEVQLPAGARLRYPGGNLLKNLTVTPMPADRPPFPLPPGVSGGILLTLQLHGAHVENTGDVKGGIRIIYPNYAQLPAGAKVNLWNYEPMGRGWYVYGKATVTRDRTQIVPDPGVELQSMHCNTLMETGGAPPDGPKCASCATDGDPVDLGTGLFVYEKTDLVLPDTVPVALTRTYRQNDSNYRGFGYGMTHPWQMFIMGDTYNYGEIILPDGARVRFQKVPNSDEFEHTATPSRFYKARMKLVEGSLYGYTEGSIWEVTLRDGTKLLFIRKTLMANVFFITRSATSLYAIIDRHGNRLSIERDADLRVTRVVSPNGKWIQLIYTAGGLTQARDNTNRTVNYAYDANGNLWKVTDAAGGITEYTYDANHRMLTIKDARGITFLTNEYDQTTGRITKQTQADGSIYQFAYAVDQNGKITQTDVTDPRGFVRRTNFNENGYWLSDTYAQGTPVQQTYTYERQAVTNLVTKATDPLGRKTVYGYDAAGNVTSVTGMAETTAAVTTAFTYEPRFQKMKSVTDPLNHTTNYEYNMRGDLVSVTDALGNRSRFEYNAAGQPVRAIDPLGNAVQLSYDAGQLVEAGDPLGRTMRREYDAAGRLVKVVDATGRATAIEYNAHNLPTRVIAPGNEATAFTYDANGNLLTVTDARGKVTSYSYNGMDRVATRTDPVQKVETYEYDLAGNLIKQIDRRGKATVSRYDALGRTTLVGFGAVGTSGSESFESQIGYSYDAGDRLLQAVDSAGGTISRVYNDLARTASETSGQGTLSYAYDVGGRLQSMTVAGQSAVNYSYDDVNRLTGIVQGGQTIGIQYDAASRRARLVLANNVTVDYGYDAASQLTSLTYKQGTTTLGDLSYEHDQLGRRVGVGGSYARVSLPQALPSPTYNDANQLTARGSQTFAYDDNGNLTSDGTNTYSWNARNQLSSITGATQASFQYDAFGRRTQRTVNSQTTSYLYDGQDAVQEQRGGTLANLIVGGTDEVFARSESGSTRTLLQDGLGSTLSVLNLSGSTETSFTYEPFGKTSETGTTSNHRGQFTGRENDGTGLYFYRARYYSPALQRFISQDPVGFAGGDVNLYAYVKNDAINYTDPSGQWLTPDTALDIAFIGYGIYALVTSDRKDNTDLWLDLGADFAGLLIPGATGLGALRRAGRAVDAAGDVGNSFRRGPDIVPMPSERSARRAAEREAGMGRHGSREYLPDEPFRAGSRPPQGDPGMRSSTRDPRTGRIVHHDPWGHKSGDIPPHYGVDYPNGGPTKHFTYPSCHNPKTNR